MEFQYIVRRFNEQAQHLVFSEIGRFSAEISFEKKEGKQGTSV